MTVYSQERHGITSIRELANSIIDDMAGVSDARTTHKFRLVNPGSVAFNPTVVKATLETTIGINSLQDGDPANDIVPQPWRIVIDGSQTGIGTPDEALLAGLRIYVGTELQLLDTGEITDEFSQIGATARVPDPANPGFFIDQPLPDGIRKSGELSVGTYPATNTLKVGQTLPFFSYDCDDVTDTFSKSIKDLSAHPIAYRITITDHGIALCIWLEGSDNFGDKFAWFNIQRNVDTTTGLDIPGTLIPGKYPVFGLFSTGGGKPYNIPYTFNVDISNIGLPTVMPKIFKIVVRETDVNKPSVPVNACIDTIDSKAVINVMQQVSIYENQTFSLTMPNGFNTARYTYKEEMDQILYTSADVISQWHTVQLAMFGKTRTYTAMQSNLPDNAGLRILFLTKEV